MGNQRILWVDTASQAGEKTAGPLRGANTQKTVEIIHLAWTWVFFAFKTERITEVVNPKTVRISINDRL